MSVVLEAYVNGVSTRKVDRLVEQLGIDGMTKDRVSAMCRALDERVEAFRCRLAGVPAASRITITEHAAAPITGIVHTSRLSQTSATASALRSQSDPATSVS